MRVLHKLLWSIRIKLAASCSPLWPELSLEDATHLEEFQEAEGHLTGFQVHLICADQQGYLDARTIHGVEGKKVFLCGPKEMRHKLLKELNQLNVPPKNIHYEDFDFF